MALTTLRIPVTDIVGQTLTRQNPMDRCRDFELRVVECAEAYGTRLGVQRCRDYFDDLQECLMQRKQLLRIDAMEKERQRQYKSGERPVKYLPDPKQDVFNRLDGI
ncbi:NADH dehydrogenase [ubiquinone] iron-sulfur protein 5 [Chamberlinius hualienensis]